MKTTLAPSRRPSDSRLLDHDLRKSSFAESLRKSQEEDEMKEIIQNLRQELEKHCLDSPTKKGHSDMSRRSLNSMLGQPTLFSVLEANKTNRHSFSDAMILDFIKEKKAKDAAKRRSSKGIVDTDALKNTISKNSQKEDDDDEYDTMSICSDISFLRGMGDGSDSVADGTTTSALPDFIIDKGSEELVSDGSRAVRFGLVEIRVYEQILGENPACRTGPSLEIGWNYTVVDPIKVSSYERARKRSTKTKLVNSLQRRQQILKKLGYSETEIAAAIRRKNRIRNSRRNTLVAVRNEKYHDRITEKVRDAAQKLKRLVFFKTAIKK